LAAVFTAVLFAITLAGVTVGSVVVTRHRAQAAADLAALAAAARLPAGPDAACTAADAVARSMHADRVGCEVDDLDVIVTVDIAVRLARGALPSVRAAARAGPAGPGG
jgi:secretion/DNA translocation related TadE-like protein